MNSAEYAQTGNYLDEQSMANASYWGVHASTVPNNLNAYYFHTARPAMGQATFVPVSIDTEGNSADLSDPNVDPLKAVFGWNRQLQHDAYIRGDQKLTQHQPTTPSKRIRGIANTFTRELEHPITGESTNMIQFSYVPAYPTVVQQRNAIDIIAKQGPHALRRNYDNDRYWRNMNQSFRYSVKKG